MIGPTRSHRPRGRPPGIQFIPPPGYPSDLWAAIMAAGLTLRQAADRSSISGGYQRLRRILRGTTPASLDDRARLARATTRNI